MNVILIPNGICASIQFVGDISLYHLRVNTDKNKLSNFHKGTKCAKNYAGHHDIYYNHNSEVQYTMTPQSYILTLYTKTPA